MRVVIGVVFSMVLAFAGQPSQAALSEQEKAQLDALPLAKMCRSSGGLDLQFGATDHGLSYSATADKPHSLRPEFSPFHEARFEISTQSRRFFSARLDANFANTEDAAEAILRLGARYRAEGWVSEQQGFDGLTFDGAINYDDVFLYSAAGNVVGASLMLKRYQNSMMLICTGWPLSLLAKAEFWSITPLQTEMPSLPPELSLPSYKMADCTNDKKRKQIFAVRDFPAVVAAQLQASSELVDWKVATLHASGKFDAVAIKKKLQPLQATYEYGMRATNSYVSSLLYFEVTNQSDHACEVTVRGLARLNAVIQEVSPALTAMHTLLNQEAVRVGVSFKVD
jgi:hypothetical protein